MILMEKDYFWKPSWSPVIQESFAHPHIEKEQSHLFDVADGGSTEYEILNWLHATIRALKPKLILETGAWEGLGTVAMAHACKINGFGKVHSLEISPSQCVRLQTVLEEQRLLPWAEVHCCDSIQFLNESNLIFDIGFFDSLTEIRPIECEILLKKNCLTKMAIFHDTSPYRAESASLFTSAEVQEEYRQKIFSLSKNYPNCTGIFDSPLSRGFMALFLKS